ncbi:MAG: cbb3-type cytochrome c oxidase subunit I, partial [Phycisphaerales bacterium JB039]
MTTIDDPRIAAGAHDDGHHDESYLASRGSFFANVLNWATTIDHKKIGVMYLFAVLFMFFLGGVMAIVVRAELFTPTREVVQSGTTVLEGSLFSAWAESKNEAGQLYNRVMTLHGAIMVFLFIVPSIPASLGNFFLPLMIGAKDVAFPRLNLLSWYVYLFGSVFAVLSIILGGVDTGWTFYTPYSTIT